ncbi:MAG: hypothetical protein DWQ37_04380 [Planctomycetota bacterium]|nr:MAG: hypothetical protein DWQ37_04380 [Planctomycetota bacterium]
MSGCRSFRGGNAFGSKVWHYLLALAASLAAATSYAAEPLTYYGFDGKNCSPEAAAGLEEIFAGHLFNYGVPAAAAKFLMSSQSGYAKKLGWEPGSQEALFYAFGKFHSPEDRQHGDDPTFGLGESVYDRDGTAMVTFNCFSCHAGVVNGQVVAGLGNNHINQSDRNRVRTRGDNFGPYSVWRMGARMADPEKKGMEPAAEPTELLKLLDSLELPPVDPMPWWTMKYKRWNYWYSDGGSHNAANFSVNFTIPSADVNERRAEHVATVAKALAFARETQSPLYPGSLDADLVKKGADLFHGRTKPAAEGFRACTSCHGKYTKKADSDYSQPGSWTVAYRFSDTLRNVGTDAAYSETLRQLGPIAEHINKLKVYFTEQGMPELTPSARVPDRPGYVAPPLVGVWASAPYFHNGSVPTVEAVLNSKLRPEIWARDNRDPCAYDLEKVGMQYRPVTREEFDTSATATAGKPYLSPEVIDHGTLYDTREFGHGNGGHPFGDKLTADERAAIIEFLKSLSGPDMPPAEEGQVAGQAGG